MSEHFEVVFHISEPSRPKSLKLRAKHWGTLGHTDGGRLEAHVLNHNERLRQSDMFFEWKRGCCFFDSTGLSTAK